MPLIRPKRFRDKDTRKTISGSDTRKSLARGQRPNQTGKRRRASRNTRKPR